LSRRAGRPRSAARAVPVRSRRLPPATRTYDPLVRAVSRRAMGQAAALRDHQPGPSQRLPGISHGVADDGLARTAPARLPLRHSRRDAALRLAGISRPLALPRLARSRVADRDARRAALS